ncbi:MAG: RluA family pseudouridine synthase [Erysipelotrichaceae bacterium]|nr:RluA family pseudouridine synthase [Erysipelotrichaceae bacterium]MBO4538412.1 RluA family pseudouridine synthase [Erysipelotrichaceae bacterium]
MSVLNFTADEAMTGLRIDKALNDKVDFSRTRLQQLISDGLVEVNDEVVKANYKLRNGDEITVEVPEAVEYSVQPYPMDLDIRYEDDDVIVINKPKGLIVHPSASTKEHTLVEGVLYHCHDLSGINGVMRPGVVHRIDKDTTGLIIMAKNDKAHQALADQLADKTMSRKYYALVSGVIPHDSGTVNAPIGRNPLDRQSMAVTDKNGKDAVTQFFVRERFKKNTLIECHLKTGRTHQIRVHMQYIGYPIVGDPKYAPKRARGDGQLLHAFELTFIHPTTGERITVNAPLPDNFAAYLEKLREEGK